MLRLSCGTHKVFEQRLGETRTELRAFNRVVHIDHNLMFLGSRHSVRLQNHLGLGQRVKVSPGCESVGGGNCVVLPVQYFLSVAVVIESPGLLFRSHTGGRGFSRSFGFLKLDILHLNGGLNTVFHYRSNNVSHQFLQVIDIIGTESNHIVFICRNFRGLSASGTHISIRRFG